MLFGGGTNASEMAADVHANGQHVPGTPNTAARRAGEEDGLQAEKGHMDDDDHDDEEEEEEEDEPKLKYTKLTGSLTNVYRNGDSTSAFLVAGDKMLLGTHNGNVHVLGLPSLQPLRTYHAHSASITSISVSPTPPAPNSVQYYADPPPTTSPPPSIRRQPTSTTSPRVQRTTPQQTAIPNTPSNAIYIATASLDGHVCVTSLLDPKDVQLRNFARPLQAVALSPQYTYDRTYLSGGLAGQLVLTVGGKAGVTVDANTNSAAAAAGGWLSGLGLAADRGKDSVLHSGEGKIGEIKWSPSGKWVVWINEEGIKIMRSHLKLGPEESEDAWRRIAHAGKPNRNRWEDLAGVWRGKAVWVNEKRVEADLVEGGVTQANGSTKPTAPFKYEKLVVGWGDTAWILHVTEGGRNAAGKKQIGSADIVHKMLFRDCIVSGITLFTPTTLAILAYRTKDDDDNPIQQPTPNTTPKKGRSHRHTGLAPQLRLILVASGEEIDLDELSMSRFETLAAQDYHLSTLWIPPPPKKPVSENETSGFGALEGLWDAAGGKYAVAGGKYAMAGGKYATRMFSSSASVLSHSSGGDDRTTLVASPPGSAVGVAAATSNAAKRRLDAHPYVVEPGLKLFIMSPYDCVLAIKRDPKDRLQWLKERKQFENAWKLLNAHPEVAESLDDKDSDAGTGVGSPTSEQGNGSLADFFGDNQTSEAKAASPATAAAEREKRKVGDLWLQQLVSTSRWSAAGRVAGQVLGTSGRRWEHWVWTFAQADRFDDITPHIPIVANIRLPGVVYEIVLGHYVQADPAKLQVLLEDWEPTEELYDVGSVVKAVEARLDDKTEDGEDAVEVDSDDWKILTECLARLYLADARVKEALRLWIRVQNADAAFKLIKDENLVDDVAVEDVHGLLMLRVSREVMATGSLQDLSDASEEAIGLLVQEALRGTVHPSTVIAQLDERGPAFRPFIFFYLRALWNDSAKPSTDGIQRRDQVRRFKIDQLKDDGHALVEDNADLAVTLFAQYDRDLLLTFLKSSSLYSYEKATALCEQQHFIPELVHILSKTGQTKRALSLIIGELGDVKQAILFAKENSSKDGELWDDLLDYGMDKPAFIRGLLEEVGTAIDPIKLVRRIPEGLEIEGLRQGVSKMMREYDIHFSISEGVARVLRGEVAMGMDTLRSGQKKGVRFEVLRDGVNANEVELVVKDTPTTVEGGETLPVPRIMAKKVEAKKVRAGQCVGCGEMFGEEGKSCPVLFSLILLRSTLQKTNPLSALPAATSTTSPASSSKTPTPPTLQR